MLKWITLVEANSNNKMEKSANGESQRGTLNLILKKSLTWVLSSCIVV